MAGKELYFDDIEIGDEIGPLERVVTTDEVLKFLGVWGGPSRATTPSRFTDETTAKSEGLAGPIVPGIMTMALLSKLLTDWSPTVTLRTIDTVFRQSVLHNVPVQIRGVVTDKSISDGEAQVECDVFIENPQGERAVGAKAIVVLPQAAK